MSRSLFHRPQDFDNVLPVFVPKTIRVSERMANHGSIYWKFPAQPDGGKRGIKLEHCDFDPAFKYFVTIFGDLDFKGGFYNDLPTVNAAVTELAGRMKCKPQQCYFRDAIQSVQQ